jgi:hypothetical protein
MVQEFAEALMGAEADALCGAPYGEPSPERVNIATVAHLSSSARCNATA